MGYEYYLDSALVKPTQERWLKHQDLILSLEVKTCFDCKIFDVANWVARLSGEDGPEEMPSHEALSVSSQGAPEISSVVGQPPLLVRDHFSSPRVVAKSCKRDKGHRPSPQRPQYPNLYRCLKRRWGLLRASLYKGSVVRQGKKATHKCGSFVPLFRFHSQKPTSKRRFSKCVSSDYSCFDYHRGQTIQRRQDLVSRVGPEVLF